ncbi:hypothetical protein ADUPG1_003935, partial [Aduncisulcus paluster]
VYISPSIDKILSSMSVQSAHCYVPMKKDILTETAQDEWIKEIAELKKKRANRVSVSKPSSSVSSSPPSQSGRVQIAIRCSRPTSPDAAGVIGGSRPGLVSKRETSSTVSSLPSLAPRTPQHLVATLVLHTPQSNYCLPRVLAPTPVSLYDICLPNSVQVFRPEKPTT